jgi:hypothetical protein
MVFSGVLGRFATTSSPKGDFLLLSLATSRLSHFFSPRLNRECEAAVLPNLAFKLK